MQKRYIGIFICALTAFAAIVFLVFTIKGWNTEKVSNTSGSGTAAETKQEAEIDWESRVEEAKEAGIQEGRSVILDFLKNNLMLGKTVIETLRPLYQDELVLVSGGAYHFVPINDALKKNQYSASQLKTLESDQLEYYDGDTKISHKGIDVSRHQGKIDWAAVAADGVEFAFIRVGYRGYGESGKLVEDECFEDNINQAIAQGIKVGVYFYTQAINEAEMQEEIDFILGKIANYELQCPVVIDVEKSGNGNGRMNFISVEERTSLVKMFCRKIGEAGYQPMIYHNMEMGVLMLDLTQLEEYPKWFAYYTPQLYYPYAYDIWQYSQSGTVNGIDGNVDLNISFSPFWE